MPEQSPNQNKSARSLGIALGVTEVIYLLGLASLASGISLQFGISWALIICGGVLIFSAFYNAAQG